ncbi:hypothetical protein M9H77_22236 [Catharanthus roseus]|uniref:Uncharacterized protein n=1 Tax=Catharanthus roseus TaxID=4058 RepID=A0ACC0ASI6_CATRO|nr:hypothetical protein M9H77_22236 [Catharanthus roseus]
MEFMRNNTSTQGTSSNEDEEKTWNLIHKLPVQPKIRMFLWKATSDILPTGRNLIKHGRYESNSYAHCGCTVEEDRHALFDCSFSKEFWRHLPKGKNWRQIPSLNFKDIICSISVEHSMDELAIFGTTAWLLWHARNKLKHERTTSLEATIALQALNMTEEYLALMRQIGHQPSIIIRNHMGIPLLAIAVPQHSSFSVNFGERWGIIADNNDCKSQMKKSVASNNKNGEDK